MKITPVICVYKSELKERPHRDRSAEYQNKYLLKAKSQVTFKSLLSQEAAK
jgi:hypothetical protein